MIQCVIPNGLSLAFTHIAKIQEDHLQHLEFEVENKRRHILQTFTYSGGLPKWFLNASDITKQFTFSINQFIFQSRGWLDHFNYFFQNLITNYTVKMTILIDGITIKCIRCLLDWMEIYWPLKADIFAVLELKNYRER